jgi:SAM-dependent MidA family methyltransferase
MPQGAFLEALGLSARAERLSANAGETTRARLRSEVERLAGPAAMGTLFKALAITRAGIAVPPFAV